MKKEEQIANQANSMRENNDSEGLRSLITANQWLLNYDCVIGRTLLHDACNARKYNNIAELLRAGASVTATNQLGETPLDLLKKIPYFYHPDYKKYLKKLERLEIKAKSAQVQENFIRIAHPSKHISRCMKIIYSGDKNVIKTIDTALELLIVGHTQDDTQDLTEAALTYIRNMNPGEYEYLKERSKKNPLIVQLVSNIDQALQKYPSIIVDDLLPGISNHYLKTNINDYLDSINTSLSNQLNKLTQLEWTFNGVQFKSSNCCVWYVKDPKHPIKYSNIATRVLIARGFLSGQTNRSGQDHTFMTNN